MQPHTDSLEPRSLVAYDAGFNQPCFYAPDLHSSFESLEYIFHISCYACVYIYIYQKSTVQLASVGLIQARPS